MGKNFKQVIGLCSTALLLATLCACGDDSSSKAALDSSSSAAELSSNGTGGSSSSTDTTAISSSSATSALKGLLVEDFNDGNGTDLLGEGWYTYTDESNGGASTFTTAVDAEGKIAATALSYDSSKAFAISYKLNKGTYQYDPYIGWGVNVSTIPNLGRFGGISYYYKGGKHYIHLETSDVTDYDVYQMLVPASNVWKKVTIRFADLTQGGWGAAVDWNAQNLTAISFQVKGNGIADSVLLDDIYLMDSSEVVKDSIVNDLTIKAPVIPEVTIGDIAITNPLQAKAEKYLNKGLNFTNWLENADGKFTAFKYGEADIKLMSENGIKGLRLPIDLDLYANNKAKFLAGTEAVLDIDTTTLFTVLDSFATWTERYGISFTIDYHEYDGSYDATTSVDTTYRAIMAILWKRVAAHFAENTREDIFFELMNEPGMAAAITAANWTATAQGMIDSIRTVDKKHTILFGDTRWYDISALVKRTPFTDTNIIYVIHCYEPFLFTHQSASWTDYGMIKNIPFPYDTTKWSTQSAYFGVRKTTSASVKNTINNYYKVGSKEYILKLMLQAKTWAVKNNVPIICNEFGAYNKGSSAESRLNYYKAFREAADTLQIPWQHWGYDAGGFQLFSNGALIDGIKNALDL